MSGGASIKTLDYEVLDRVIEEEGERRGRRPRVVAGLLEDWFATSATVFTGDVGNQGCYEVGEYVPRAAHTASYWGTPAYQLEGSKEKVPCYKEA